MTALDIDKAVCALAEPFVVGDSSASEILAMVDTTAKVMVGLEGLPKPTARWTFNGHVLLEDETKYDMNL